MTDRQPTLELDSLAEPGSHPVVPAGPVSPRQVSTPGGSRELLVLALPLILSMSFMTVQVAVDRILLSRHDPDEVAAAFPAVMLFWLPFALLQGTASYVATFVAQYTGASRPERVGPAVWQGLYFSLAGGLLFLLMVPAAPFLVGLGGHAPHLQQLEVLYLRYLAFSALPMAVVAAANGFFSGRGDTWTVLGIDALGTGVNAVLAMVLILGVLGFPEMGIEGAGIATVVGSWTSALFALALLSRKKFRETYGTISGWRLERELFGRLLRFGGPNGIQMFLDVLAFTLFTLFVGRLGAAAMGAAPPAGGVRERARPGEVRRHRRHRPEPAHLRGDLLGRGQPEPHLLIRAARGRRHPLRHLAHLPLRLADHGDPDLPRGHLPRGVRGTLPRPGRSRVLGVGVRHRSHHRHVALLLAAIPQRQVEEHAGDRTGQECLHPNTRDRGFDRRGRPDLMRQISRSPLESPSLEFFDRALASSHWDKVIATRAASGTVERAHVFTSINYNAIAFTGRKTCPRSSPAPAAAAS
jgi:hypothetical protein